MSIDTTTKTSSIGVNGIFETTMAGDILWKDDGNLVKNTFSNILLIIFTLFILYGVVQALSSFLKDGIWWELISKAVDLWWQALSMIPVPLPWWGTSSIWSVGRTIEKRIDTIGRTLDNRWRDQDTAIENQIRKSMGLKTNLYSDSYKWLKKLTDSITKSSKITKTQYNDIIKEYKNSGVLEYYKWEKVNLSTIDSREHTLQSFFEKLTPESFKSEFGWELSKPWQTWDKWDTIESFIKNNYNKTTENKKFFDDLYNDIWWDVTWSINRDKEIKRKK
jgi:hypothetical protein